MLLPTACPGPIGVFDSGFGGLTILRDIRRRLPAYDYLFLGDNARAPYGTRSFDVVYGFTLAAVRYLFAQGCHLVVLACNTASAKALRSIQQRDLPALDPQRRVLGVIRPTVEALPALTRTGHVGLVATPGTVASRSYEIEVQKMHPAMTVAAQPCPMWVPLVENSEGGTAGARFFVERDLRRLMERDPAIDTVILGCTHYPLLLDDIRAALPEGVAALSQGPIVADSLADYLERHPEMARRCTRGGAVRYLTTESAGRFDDLASMFMGERVAAEHVDLT